MPHKRSRSAEVPRSKDVFKKNEVQGDIVGGEQVGFINVVMVYKFSTII